MRSSMFREMLSGITGEISSKRSVMIFFVVLFATIVIVNISTGKKLEHDLQFQLFELVIISMATVFGERFIDRLGTLRGQKTTATTTTIAPPDSVVTTTETTKETK
jgi:hypothetical protein